MHRSFLLLALLFGTCSCAWNTIYQSDFAADSFCSAGQQLSQKVWVADGQCQSTGMTSVKGKTQGNEVTFVVFADDKCQLPKYGPTTCYSGVCCNINDAKTGFDADVLSRLQWHVRPQHDHDEL
eukprot:TRINITY_DN17645_c0_g1_i1.p1 TRINITY_DN17645_c0_g1~~TRINITY_DN17645_c0_g1_i1.p1  ORF type:complete len:124 (+),score=19.71 TRINITY_DN17645_c0_g1_i1:356-727(+)